MVTAKHNLNPKKDWTHTHKWIKNNNNQHQQVYNFWYVKHALNFLSFQNFMCLFFALVFTLFPVTTELIDITIIKATKNNNISNQI